MFSPLLLALSLSVDQHTIGPGHHRFYLQADTTLFLTIGSLHRAFVMGTNNFITNSNIRIITGNSYQDIYGIHIASPAASFTSDRAEIYFTAHSASDVEIWIIRSDVCPSRALFLEASGDYDLDFHLFETSTFCVFPFFSSSRSLTYGFPSSRGQSEIRIVDDRSRCHDRVCSAEVSSPHYAVFLSRGGQVTLHGRHSNVASRNCYRHWFAYIEPNGIFVPSLPDEVLSLTCPGQFPQHAERPKEDGIDWDIVCMMFAALVLIIIIVFVSVKCGDSWHLGRFYHPAPPPPTPVYFGGPGYVQPPVYVGGPTYFSRGVYDEPHYRRERGFREHVHFREDEYRDRERNRNGGEPFYRNVPPPAHLEPDGFRRREEREQQQRPRFQEDAGWRNQPAGFGSARERPVSFEFDGGKQRNVPPPAPPGMSRAPQMQGDNDEPKRRNVPPPAPPGLRKAPAMTGN